MQICKLNVSWYAHICILNAYNDGSVFEGINDSGTI